MNDNADNDPRLYAIPDIHGHAKGEHKAFSDERPIPLSARMLFLWFYHACRRGWPRFLMVTDHMNYLTFEDPAAISLVRRALKLAQAGDLYGAAETASVEVGHAAVVSEGLRRGMRYSIGAEVDNDPRSRPDAQNIVDAMKPDGMIRSVHFLTIDHPTHGPNWNWPFDNPEFTDVFDLVGTNKTWELYMTTLLDAVERLPGNILGHFYVPAIFGHWPDDATLEAYEDAIVDACEARGMAIEFNTRFLYREHPVDEKAKFLTANRRLLAKCKAKNVGVAVGSDAHSPKDQGRAFDTVLALLDECEINELVFPLAGRLARVALRVERKVEPVAEPVPQAVEERKPARKPRSTESAALDDAPSALASSSENGSANGPAAKPRPKRSKTKVVSTATLQTGDAEPRPPTRDAEPPTPTRDAEPPPPAGDAEPPPTVIAASSPPDAGDTDRPTDVLVTESVLDETISVESIVDIVTADLVTTADDDAGGDGDGAAEPTPGLLDEPAVAQRTGSGDGNVVGDASHASDVDERNSTVRSRPRQPAKTKAKSGEPAPTKSAVSIAKEKTAPKKAARSAAKPSRQAVKKSVVKKAPAKKAVAKKTPLKKATTKKVAPKKAAAVRVPAVKKNVAKKGAAKKAGTKKPAPKRR